MGAVRCVLCHRIKIHKRVTMKNKRDRETDTILKVPNTEEGRQFLRQLAEYKVAGVRIRVRGRGPRASVAEREGVWRRRFDQDIPQKLAAWFGVYIRKSGFETVSSFAMKQLREQLRNQFMFTPKRSDIQTLLAKLDGKRNLKLMEKQ